MLITLVGIMLAGFANFVMAEASETAADSIGEKERNASLLRLSGIQLFGSLELQQVKGEDPKSLTFEVTYLDRQGLVMTKEDVKNGYVVKFFTDEEKGEQIFDGDITVTFGDTAIKATDYSAKIEAASVKLKDGKFKFNVVPEKKILKITVAVYDQEGNTKFDSITLVLEKYNENRDYELYYNFQRPFNYGFLKAMNYNRNGSKREYLYKVYIKDPKAYK